MIPKTKVARFMDEALKIQDIQRKSGVWFWPLMNTICWRKIQKELMPLVGDKVAAQALTPPPIQDEKLFLPSDFPAEIERHIPNLGQFGGGGNSMERRPKEYAFLIRDGAIFVFGQEESRIKVWTDKLCWSTSFTDGNFVINVQGSTQLTRTISG
ncbi:hypothetical protein B0H14DRAFT_2596449 [Mycena olivaceomarginata]|nr:hypothetical protein B0H14DRAFT_2596449 [Mycena olivaceomarginata]